MTIGAIFNVSPYTEILTYNIFTILCLTTESCFITTLETIGMIFLSKEFLPHYLPVKIILSFQLFIKCFSAYICLACHVIAMYPLLTGDLPDLLVPTIIFHFFRNIFLNILEFSAGCVYCSYSNGFYFSCLFFALKLVFKFMLSTYIMCLYMYFYNNMPPTIRIKKEKLCRARKELKNVVKKR